MALTDGVQLITEFIAKRSAELSQTIFGATNRATGSAAGQLQNATVARSGGSALDTIKSNPLVNMGIDTANQAITTVTQQLVVTGAKQLEQAVNRVTGIPVRKTIQDVTDGYFSAVALASTASVEVAMEIARTNARSIVALIATKEQIIKDLRAEIQALYNAMIILLNSQPFFSAYYQQLIVAFQEIKQADAQLQRVVSNLATFHRYNSVLYEQSLNLLVKAQTAILPDRSAQVGEIRNAGDFLSDTITRKTNKDALAAAMNIPMISATIGAKYLTYVETTVAINALIALFLTALNDFISTYKRNDNLDANTINHIKAGTAQLETLLADMGVVLFPGDPGVPLTQVSPTFTTQVTTSATGWGLRLTAIIEWLKIQPGRASSVLDTTSESVLRYQNAITLLKSQGNITSGLGTLVVTQSQENVLTTTRTLAKLLFYANTVVGTQRRPADVKQRLQQLLNLFDCSNILDANIKTALTPFINTPFNLLNGAGAVVKQMTKVARDLGLDRAADLLQKADIKGFYSLTGTTATYAGAASAGVSAILVALNSNPSASQNDASVLQKIRDLFDRQNSEKQVEASRSSSASVPVFVATQKKDVASDTKLANQGIQVAQTKDPTIAQDPATYAKKQLSTAIGNKTNFGGIP